ncbi:hypothetical protein NIES4073_64150 [Kalymmatonema gypsitolerans NIES-4073]|nr:hypothetical protein NIES4073_64150 [Scytonema sp. NIES-4073]
MARLYADEQFPKKVSELLRTMGHDVLTVQEAGNANLGIPDEEVLAFAVSDNRAVITLNRQDFIRLHRANPVHFGIITCTNILIESEWQFGLTKRCLTTSRYASTLRKNHYKVS